MVDLPNVGFHHLALRLGIGGWQRLLRDKDDGDKRITNINNVIDNLSYNDKTILMMMPGLEPG